MFIRAKGAHLSSPKGWDVKAQGNALGDKTAPPPLFFFYPALKGQNKIKSVPAGHRRPRRQAKGVSPDSVSPLQGSMKNKDGPLRQRTLGDAQGYYVSAFQAGFVSTECGMKD